MPGKPGDIKLYYYAEQCKASAQVLGNHGHAITEVLIPLCVDENPKEIMGVLMFGQLIIGGHEEDLTDEEKSRWFPSIPAALKQHAGKIWEFLRRMGTRIDIHRMDFLFSKQEELLQKFDDDIKPDNTEVAAAIKKLFENVCDSFDVKRCILFLPETAAKDAGQKHLAGYDVLLKTDCKDVMLHPGRLYKVVEGGDEKGFQTFLPDGCLQGVDYDPETCNLYHHFNRNYGEGLAVFVEWNRMSRAPRKRQALLFKSLLSACYASIMTQIADIERNAISTFTESTRHDLSQKLAILGMHNKAYAGPLAALRRRAADESLYLKYIAEASTDYHKDMRGLYYALSFLINTLDSPTMHETPDIKSFMPYSRFLFNMIRQYQDRSIGSIRAKDLRYALPHAGEPEMVADPVMVERIVTNLLSNADKYAYDGTNIYLEYYFDFGRSCFVFKVTPSSRSWSSPC
jgi:hypothetical protein